MSDVGVQPIAGVSPGLTQWQRVVDTFSAPSKTFTDIKAGNRSWWMPFLIVTLVGYILFAAVTMKIGMQTVVDNQMHLDPKNQDRMASMTPDQKASAAKISVAVTQGVFLATPLLILATLAVGSLILLGTINFGFGGKAKFGSIFTVWMYASLPTIVKTLLGVIVIFAGTAPESFNIKNFAPTNPAAFLNPLETNKALYALASSLDVVTIWSMILLGMGIAIVAGVKRSTGYTAVFAWWALLTIISVGWAAAFS